MQAYIFVLFSAPHKYYLTLVLSSLHKHTCIKYKIYTNADTFIHNYVAPYLTSMPNKSKKTMLSIKIPELYKAIFRAGEKKKTTLLHN